MNGTKKWILPHILRAYLKIPLGTLFIGPPKKVWQEIALYLSSIQIKKFVTVGDIVTFNCLKHTQIIPDIMIIDRKTLRKKHNFDFQTHLKERNVNFSIVIIHNPAGTLTAETVNALQKIYKTDTKILLDVNGEEDLVTIPAVIYAPINSVIVYGQPSQGVVLIRVTTNIKKKFENIFRKMEEVNNGA